MVKAHAIHIEAKLPENLWLEIVQTTGYLANKSSSKSLNWMILYKKLHFAQSNLIHLKVFGCCTYSFIPKEHCLRMEKLQPWAHIGYLVGYNSTNIYHIWIPSTSIIIPVQDVTFDKSTQYNTNDVLTDEQLCQHVENIMQDIGLDDTEAKPPAQFGTEFIDILAADTPYDTYGRVTPSLHKPHKAELAGILTPPSGTSMQPLLPTLLQTPKSCTNQTNDQKTLYKVATALSQLEPVEKAYMTTVGTDLDSTNILESCTHSQQVAYLADIEEPMQMISVHSAFTAGQ